MELILIGMCVLMGVWLVWRLRRGGKKKKIRARLATIQDFTPTDIFISDVDLNSVAADRERQKIALTVADKAVYVMPISRVVACEVMQDDSQIAYANRGSQAMGVVVGGALLGGVGAIIGGLSGSQRTESMVRQITLRIGTDDYDHPVHDIVMLDAEWEGKKKGLKRTDPKYRAALQNAERWHGRIVALMRAAGR